MPTKLDYPQVIKAVYDETNNALKITGGGGSGNISDINGATGPSISILPGTNITVGTVGNNITINSTGGGSGANTTLSNLTSPTAFNQNLLPSTNNTLSIGDATHKINSLDVTTIKNNGATVIEVNAFTTLDNVGQASIDFTNRLLTYNDGSTSSLDWQNGFAQDSTGTTSLIYGPSRQLVDTTSQTALDWSVRNLIDSAAHIVMDWEAKEVYDITGFTSMGWNARSLYGPASNQMLNWSTTGILDAKTNKITNVVDPTSPQDAATKNYVDTAGGGANTALSNLSSTAINANLNFDTNDLYFMGSNGVQLQRIFVHRICGSNNYTILNTNTAQINDRASENLVFDLNSRTLYDSSGGVPMLSFLTSGTISANTNKISNVVDPVAAQDAATKAYVDSSTATFSYQTPSTGFSITIPNLTQRLILDPAGTLATGTITMPSTPVNGQVVGISSTQIITALTVQGNTGQTMADTITTIGVGGAATFLYRLANTKWYRIAN